MAYLHKSIHPPTNQSEGRTLSVSVSRIRVDVSYLLKIQNLKDQKSIIASVKQDGICTPLAVTKRNGIFILKDGLRRLIAAIALGLKTVPCVFTDHDHPKLALIGHYQTKKMTAIELVYAFKQMVLAGYRQKHLAILTGKSKNRISSIVKISELPEIILKNASACSMRTLEELACFNVPEDALKAFSCIQYHGFTSNDLRKIRHNMKSRQSSIEIESFIISMTRLKKALRKNKISVSADIYKIVKAESVALLRELKKNRLKKFRVRNFLKYLLEMLGIKKQDK